MCVLNGKQIFFLMDSRGMPLDIITDILREKGLCFDVVAFTEAALNSGNFTYSKIKSMLLGAMKGNIDVDVKREFETILDYWLVRKRRDSMYLPKAKEKLDNTTKPGGVLITPPSTSMADNALVASCDGCGAKLWLDPALKDTLAKNEKTHRTYCPNCLIARKV